MCADVNNGGNPGGGTLPPALGDISLTVTGSGAVNETLTVSTACPNAHHIAVNVVCSNAGVNLWFYNEAETYIFTYTPTAAGTYTIIAAARNTATENEQGTEKKETSSTVTIYTSNLKLGDTGAEVTVLQQNLISIGYSLNAAGTFDSVTDAAVRLFQGLVGSVVDGIAGPNTRSRLSTVVDDKNSGWMSRGMIGTNIQQLQKDLNKLGFGAGVVDSKFGADTYNAVVSFQRSQGLLQNGIVGPATKNAIIAALTALAGTISVTGVTYDSVTLRITNGAEKKVRVFRPNDNSSTDIVITVQEASAGEKTISLLLPNTAYIFRLIGINGSEESSVSATTLSQGTGNEVTFTYNGKTIKLINPNNNNSSDPYQSTGNTDTAVVIIGEHEVSDAMLRSDGTLVANISDMAFSLGGNLANGTRITDDYFEFEVYHPDTVTWSRKGYFRSDLFTNPSGGAPLISVQQLATDLGFSDKLTIATHSDGSKEAYIDKVDDGQDLFNSIASMILGFLPGVGDAKDIQEAVTGYDIITGQRLSVGDRCITASCAFLPIINGAAVRVGKKGLTKIDNLIEAADNLSDLERAAYRASLWNLRPTLRGLLLEKELARTEYNLATTGWYHIGAENSGYFPVIDFWKGKDVVSLKSIDPRLYSGSGATERLLDYLDDLKCDILVDGQKILNTNKKLDIRVPSGTISQVNIHTLLDEAEGIIIDIREF